MATIIDGYYFAARENEPVEELLSRVNFSCPVCTLVATGVKRGNDFVDTLEGCTGEDMYIVVVLTYTGYTGSAEIEAGLTVIPEDDEDDVEFYVDEFVDAVRKKHPPPTGEPDVPSSEAGYDLEL